MTEIRFYGSQGPCPWLSNFAYTPFVDRQGKIWPTAEHAFQAMKSVSLEYRETVRGASTPALAKRLGRTVPLRPGWHEMRIEVMRRVLAAKFPAHSQLALLLLDTGNAALIEDSPHDYFWGCGRKGTGDNRLGELLEERRDWLREIVGPEPEEHGRTQG